MSLRKLGSALVFLAGAIIGGLALAFLAVFFRPELLQHAPAAAVPPASVVMPRGTTKPLTTSPVAASQSQ